MSQFIQLHMLTSYPPANLNRDDLGRPKTAVVGGSQRLRISSQSLKRAWRTSDIFEEALAGHIGKRTKIKGVQVYHALVEKGVAEKKAKSWAQEIAGVFGALKKENKNKPLEDLEIEQLAHFSPEEESAINALIETMVKRGDGPTDDEKKLLQSQHTAVDIAMFGRMLASSPAFNMEAAVQVSHAFSVQKVAIEDDYFTAVDDLNSDDNTGSAHIGESEFAAGLFYTYICINRDLLVENLSGNEALANKALRALVEAATKIAPGGKQNSYASRARASYLLAEKGCEQPRSLAVSYLQALNGEDFLTQAIESLNKTRNNIDKVYGPCAESHYTLNAHSGEGSLSELLNFVGDTQNA